MKRIIPIICLLLVATSALAQNFNDYLPADFHQQRRDILRSKMPKNSVVVVFANPVRNRANDVDYVYHQDPNFYYLTGFREPDAVLVMYSENQTDASGNTFNEVLYVPKKDPRFEMWNGERLGAEGAKKELGFKVAKTSEEFIKDNINFKQFDKIFTIRFEDDYRNSVRNKAEVFDLVQLFKKNSGYNPSNFLSQTKKYVYELIKSTPIENSANVAQIIGRAVTYYPDLKDDVILKGYKDASDAKTKKEFQQKATLLLDQKVDVNFLLMHMAEMRQVKTPAEMKLLTKAIRISAVGQIEVMKAMKPHMSEREIQGIHEFVYKKYGAEYEGYPSIVGAGNNGCILHYIKNRKKHTHNDLVLMDLGAEYRGYTADVTRTIPANGKFSDAQKAIYNIVLDAQTAGIEACTVGNPFGQPNTEARKVINEGLFKLGIIKSVDEKHNYLPHGTSHYLGLDVHDPGMYGPLQENMVITVEPGIYIPEGSPCDKKWWGIAIRIEDDILITSGKPKNLSIEAPRTVEAIEKMMAKKSILSDWVLPNLDE